MIVNKDDNGRMIFTTPKCRNLSKDVHGESIEVLYRRLHETLEYEMEPVKDFSLLLMLGDESLKTSDLALRYFAVDIVASIFGSFEGVSKVEYSDAYNDWTILVEKPMATGTFFNFDPSLRIEQNSPIVYEALLPDCSITVKEPAITTNQAKGTMGLVVKATYDGVVLPPLGLTCLHTLWKGDLAKPSNPNTFPHPWDTFRTNVNPSKYPWKEFVHKPSSDSNPSVVLQLRTDFCNTGMLQLFSSHLSCCSMFADPVSFRQISPEHDLAVLQIGDSPIAFSPLPGMAFDRDGSIDYRKKEYQFFFAELSRITKSGSNRPKLVLRTVDGVYVTQQRVENWCEKVLRIKDPNFGRAGSSGGCWKLQLEKYEISVAIHGSHRNQTAQAVSLVPLLSTLSRQVAISLWEQPMTDQLLRVAQSAYAIPPYMLQATTPNNERLILPSLPEVLKYARAKVGTKLKFSRDSLQTDVIVTSLSAEDCTLNWDPEGAGTFPIGRFHVTAALWNHLYVGRNTVSSWFLRLICFRVHSILKDVDGVISFGKSLNQSPPVKFHLCVKETEQQNFSSRKHIIDHCDVEYTAIPKWKNENVVVIRPGSPLLRLNPPPVPDSTYTSLTL